MVYMLFFLIIPPFQFLLTLSLSLSLSLLPWVFGGGVDLEFRLVLGVIFAVGQWSWISISLSSFFGSGFSVVVSDLEFWLVLGIALSGCNWFRWSMKLGFGNWWLQFQLVLGVPMGVVSVGFGFSMGGDFVLLDGFQAFCWFQFWCFKAILMGDVLKLEI